MRRRRSIGSLAALALILITGCHTQNDAEEQYINEIDEWHAGRIARLEASDGWLSLAGLFWLQPGSNTFGAGAENLLVFPSGKADETMGEIFLRDTLVTITINPGIQAYTGDSLVSGTAVLKSDATGNPTIVTARSLSWYVIKRDDRYGIRLKDSDNKNLKEFQGIERFPVDSRWKIKAGLVRYDSIRTIAVPNVLGTVTMEPCIGYLKFEIDGTEYRLDPVADADSKQYFLIFGDETNGEETYGAGRFVSVNAVDHRGETYIDFNKAYNPPCAFSPYATCPLPPDRNRLAVRITAGEKTYRGYDH